MVTWVLPGCGVAQTDVVSNIEEKLSGIKNITVNGGPLEVSFEGSPQATEVFLNAYLESNNSGYKITYKVEGDHLRVNLVQEGYSGWGNRRIKGFISLTGPETMNLEINSGSGPMYVSHVNSGRIDLSTSSGVIEAKTLRSDSIHVKASSGHMDVEEIYGRLFCRASSGGGVISRVEGDLSLVASSGGYRISKVQGVVNASLSSGSIDMEDVSELGALTVSSGGIRAVRAGLGASTRFSGSSGSFDIQTEGNLGGFNYDLSASSGSLQVGDTKTVRKLYLNNNAAQTVSGSTSSGSILIRN